MWYEWRVESSGGLGERSDVGPDGRGAEAGVGGRGVAGLGAAWKRGLVGGETEGSGGKISSDRHPRVFQNEGGLSHSIFLP